MSATSPIRAAFRPSSVISARKSRARLWRNTGHARVVTAANCFAHIEDVHAIVDGIVEMIGEDGVFISESHYLIGLLDTLQYDTVYHEHLRYYSLTSLKHLLEMHDLEVFHARPIPSHGGSIRVYAGKKGKHKVQDLVAKMLAAEPRGDAMAKRLQAIQARRAAVEAPPLVDAARPEGKRRARGRHQRAVARLDAVQLCRARRRHHRLCLRNSGLA